VFKPGNWRAAALAVATLLLVFTWRWKAWRRSESAEPAAKTAAGKTDRSHPDGARGAEARVQRGPAGEDALADKVARIGKIQRDYNDITGKASADYAAAGDAFPGGLSAFLRQLALLAREKHKDLAAMLTPRELEDFEMRETHAGQTVQHLLDDTAATEEQRRAVFRLEQEFEDQFALTFDLSPPVLLEREAARQAVQLKIRAVLGDELFAPWLGGEGGDYAAMVEFARNQQLPASAPLELWQIKNEFTVGRLQLKLRTDLSPLQARDAETALVNQTRARVAGSIGPAAMTAGNDVLGWLPRAPANAPPGK
jgi:hypothetical protein